MRTACTRAPPPPPRRPGHPAGLRHRGRPGAALWRGQVLHPQVAQALDGRVPQPNSAPLTNHAQRRPGGDPRLPAHPSAPFVGRPASDWPHVLQHSDQYRETAGDPELSEYFVRVELLHTEPVTEAFNELGLFGNQNTLCQSTTPKWRHTVDRLKAVFGVD